MNTRARRRADVIHTPWTIRASFAKERARERGDHRQPTHRKDDQ